MSSIPECDHHDPSRTNNKNIALTHNTVTINTVNSITSPAVSITAGPSSASSSASSQQIPPVLTSDRDQLITGDDLMLCDGQIYVPRFMQNSMTGNVPGAAGSGPVNPVISNPQNVQFARDSEYTVRPAPPGHQLASGETFTTSREYYPGPSVVRNRYSNMYSNPSGGMAHQHQQQPQITQQQDRTCGGSCPFLTEGHHYNRPRRFTNYVPNSRVPYAVHESLWHRQQMQQELRRLYMSPAFVEPPDAPPPMAMHHHHHGGPHSNPFVRGTLPQVTYSCAASAAAAAAAPQSAQESLNRNTSPPMHGRYQIFDPRQAAAAAAPSLQEIQTIENRGDFMQRVSNRLNRLSPSSSFTL